MMSLPTETSERNIKTVKFGLKDIKMVTNASVTDRPFSSIKSIREPSVQTFIYAGVMINCLGDQEIQEKRNMKTDLANKFSKFEKKDTKMSWRVFQKRNFTDSLPILKGKLRSL